MGKFSQWNKILGETFYKPTNIKKFAKMRKQRVFAL